MTDTPPGWQLVCPRCRRAASDGSVVRAVLRCEGNGEGSVAVPGQLDGVHALACPDAGCGARYPVVEGIAVVFRDPSAVDVASTMLCDPTSIPIATLHAAVLGQPPEAPWSALAARLSRLAWAGFHDWLAPAWQIEGVSCEVHAVQLMRWLSSVAPSRPGRGDARIVLGAGLGREAWEAGAGHTLLVDAHLPSLLAARRLLREGRIDILLRMDALGWAPVTLEARGNPASAVSLLCCDAQDPPLDAECAHQVIVPNLVDSIANPYLLLMQSRALVAEGGLLAMSSPFSWRADVTARDRWLEAMASRPDVSARDVLLRLMAGDPPGEMSVVGETELRWCMRTSSREAVVYRNVAICFGRASGHGAAATP